MAVRYPVVLGQGTPLFAPGRPRFDLRLAGNEAFASGAILGRYRIATNGETP